MATALYNNRSHDGLPIDSPQFTDTCMNFQTSDDQSGFITVPNDPTIKTVIFSYSAETWVSVNNDIGAPPAFPTVSASTQQRTPSQRSVSAGMKIYFYTAKAASIMMAFYS
ncbi:hypothetical protein UFOVP733_49 [uncultured Caudovirales phage]|uniref:Uncharacterized protein n=1 Tax=uncultured Caudovirales phage TaxID=2100421 RepID=A0A6J5NQZ2_9CAUD|nr:hypothetical protein UFOVP733_49 [uncultured Caudovirales phage]CAB5224814.1 hypothetical protein UFOVP743_10 [uncultured Caudovirales phage]